MDGLNYILVICLKWPDRGEIICQSDVLHKYDLKFKEVIAQNNPFLLMAI
jgi:hypothetical protein